MTTMEERMSRLERSAARWRGGAVGLGAALAGTLVLGMAQPDQPRNIEADVIRANVIEIRHPDDASKPGVRIMQDDHHGAGIEIYGRDHEVLADLGTIFEGRSATLTFTTAEGELLAQLSSDPDTLSGMMGLWHNGGEIGVAAVAGPDGSIIRASNVGGHPAATLAGLGHKGAGVTIDDGEHPAAMLSIDEHGNGELSLRNHENFELIHAGGNAQGSTSLRAAGPLRVYDEEGRLHRVGLGALPNEAPAADREPEP